LPSQEIAYHPGPDLAILFVLLMFKSSIQAIPTVLKEALEIASSRNLLAMTRQLRLCDCLGER
jgi:hypothetical protein